jgi:hypothetical protein
MQRYARAESDTAAHDSNPFESCGREATWFTSGKPTSLRVKHRHDDERMFGIGIKEEICLCEYFHT